MDRDRGEFEPFDVYPLLLLILGVAVGIAVVIEAIKG